MAGNDNMALLSYNEVASFFLDKNILKHEKSPKISGEPERAKFGVNKNLGICYNNIGCIHLKQKNFKLQYKYLARAIDIAEENILHFAEGNRDKEAVTPIEFLFKLACRQFNQGYGLYLNYLTLLKGNMDDRFCK